MSNNTPLRRYLSRLSLIRQRTMLMDEITRYAHSEASCAWNRMLVAGHAIKVVDARLASLDGAK